MMIYLYTYTVLCNVILYRFLLEFSSPRRGVGFYSSYESRLAASSRVSHPRSPCVRRSPRRRRLG